LQLSYFRLEHDSNEGCSSTLFTDEIKLVAHRVGSSAILVNDELFANGSSLLPQRQVSPSDFVQQPVASESTLCRLEGRMTTYSMHDRDSSLILDERGDRLALIQITARFSFLFLNLGKTLLPI